MNSEFVQAVARELLDLPVTDSEATALVDSLGAQRKTIEIIERVPLPYSADPFVSPRASEEWLEKWERK